VEAYPYKERDPTARTLKLLKQIIIHFSNAIKSNRMKLECPKLAPIVICASLFFGLNAVATEKTVVVEQAGMVSIGNGIVRLDYNLKNGAYSIVDVCDGTVAIANARSDVDRLALSGLFGDFDPSLPKDVSLSWKTRDVTDVLGSGKSLVVTYERKKMPAFLTTFTVHDGEGFITMGSGLVNNRAYGLRMKSFQPLAWGELLPGKNITDAKTLNGAAGSTKTVVETGMNRACENNLLLTCSADGKRRSVVIGGLTYNEFAKYAAIGAYKCWDTVADAKLGHTWGTVWEKLEGNRIPRNFPTNAIQVAAVDPVGRLVDPRQTYEPQDHFYVDVITQDPFVALEKYGMALRTATGAKPNVYNSLTVCGWFSGRNTSALLMKEADRAIALDMLKTTPMTYRLEPDSYCYNGGDTEQGWWDDAHWEKFRHLVAPYETFKKWISGIREKGGSTETYFQCGMPSDDYAEAFPGHMLRNDISTLHRSHPHWRPSVTFDATDPGFQAHMGKVWANLADAGIGGIKFDYPDIAWRPEGGFEDKYATTASAYRKWFQMSRDGLGPQVLLHERALGERCLDVTAGIVDLQRVWQDSNQWLPGMASICGLRWYKNRVVMSYYPDSKSFTTGPAKGTKTPIDPLKRRGMITMLYVTSGRIELAESLDNITPEIVYDLGRAFPMHTAPQSARPVDAFSGVKDPRVYAFRVDQKWQQVAFYNDEKVTVEIIAPLSGDQASTGSLGLDEAKDYYVYEFWSDRFVGKLSGSGKLKETLSAGEARMYSIREVLARPQVLSTNRHLMQGYVDLANVKWDAAKKQLSGSAKVVGGEPFRIAVAGNGLAVKTAAAQGASVKIDKQPGVEGLHVLVLISPGNAEAAWCITYE